MHHSRAKHPQQYMSPSGINKLLSNTSREDICLDLPQSLSVNRPPCPSSVLIPFSHSFIYLFSMKTYIGEMFVRFLFLLVCFAVVRFCFCCCCCCYSCVCVGGWGVGGCVCLCVFIRVMSSFGEYVSLVLYRLLFLTSRHSWFYCSLFVCFPVFLFVCLFVFVFLSY